MSFLKEQYLKQHRLRELTSQWLDALAVERPEDPLARLVELIQAESAPIVVCPNPWCEARIYEAEIAEHRKICNPSRWNKCSRCNTRVEVSKMQQHRAHCKMVNCVHCGEFVFPRMLAMCPVLVLGTYSRQGSMKLEGGSSASEAPVQEDLKITLLQDMWRSQNAQRRFQRLAFRVIWGLMDSARETRLAQGHTQLVLQPTVWGSVKNFRRSGTFLSGLEGQSIEMIPDTVTLQQLEEMQQSHSLEEVNSILQLVQSNQIIPLELAITLVEDASRILSLRAPVVNVTTPYTGETVVVGDIHGQLKDFFHILKTQGLPSDTKTFIFNGDFVDRGSNGCEVLLIIYCLLCYMPSRVYLNRGNHEDYNINKEYGFLVEIQTKYDEESKELYHKIRHSFKVMPIAHVLDNKILIVHGGVPRHVRPIARLNNIGHIQDIPTVQQQDEDEEILVDVLWGDPVERFKSRHFGAKSSSWRINSRGCGIEFLASHTQQYLAINDFQLLVRSHECVPGGYQEMHDGRCVTVFSASDYCGFSGNRGAVAKFSAATCEPTFDTWFLREKSDPREKTFSFDFVSSQLTDDNPELQKTDCLRDLRELIWANRFALMSSFCTTDVEEVGYVAKVEWCDVMRKVLELDIPWYYLCTHLANIELKADVLSVRYAAFLRSVDSNCGRKYRPQWVSEMLRQIFTGMELPDDFLKPARQQEAKRMSVLSPMTKRQSVVATSDNSSEEDESWRELNVNVNTFTTTLRSKSTTAAKLEDNDMLVLFMYFDIGMKGQVKLGMLMDTLRELGFAVGNDSDADEEVVKVDLDSFAATNAEDVAVAASKINITKIHTSEEASLYTGLMMLQKFFLFGRSRGLISSFQMLDRNGDNTLSFSELEKVFHMLNRSLLEPLSLELMERMFAVLDADGNERIDLEEFIRYFSVLDMRDEIGFESMSASSLARSLFPTTLTPSKERIGLVKKNVGFVERTRNLAHVTASNETQSSSTV